jgi:hypothetical protein
LGNRQALAQRFLANNMRHLTIATLAILIGLLLTAHQAWPLTSDARRGVIFRQEREAAADAYNKNDAQRYRDALAKFHQDFPENSRVLRNLAAAEAKLGNSQTALSLLREYGEMGATLDLQNPAWGAIRESAKSVPQLSANAAAISHGAPLFRVADPDLLVEDVSYDPRTKRFILSSVRQGKIITCEQNGRCDDFVKLTRDVCPGGVLALCVDTRREVLWATTATMEAVEGFRPNDDGQSSVLKFDLRTHKLLHRYYPDDGKKHAMGDMTIASNGDAFVSDGLSGHVFIIRQPDGGLEPLAAAGVFLSPQTPALSADEKFLYVPDYSEGIAVIRLADRRVEWLKAGVPAALEGIDGLYRFKDHLIAVQNGTQPERIVSFHMRSPKEIDRFEVLEANWTGLGDPTHGVVIGNDFYFIANSGWDRVGENGAFKPGAAAEIWKLGL